MTRWEGYAWGHERFFELEAVIQLAEFGAALGIAITAGTESRLLRSQMCGRPEKTENPRSCEGFSGFVRLEGLEPPTF